MSLGRYDGVGIQLNIDCTFNVDRVLFVSEFHALYIGSIYLGTVIHSNIHVVRLYCFFILIYLFYLEDSLGTLV